MWNSRSERSSSVLSLATVSENRSGRRAFRKDFGENETDSTGEFYKMLRSKVIANLNGSFKVSGAFGESFKLCGSKY